MWPEKYNKTYFRFQTLPNHETGFSTRVNTEPYKTEVVYTLPFSLENDKKLFDLRDNENISLVVKDDIQGKSVGIKPLTVEDTFKLFSESDFAYLYYANYLSKEEKEHNRTLAEPEGLIPKQTDDERKASILAEQALSDKQKMSHIG